MKKILATVFIASALVLTGLFVALPALAKDDASVRNEDTGSKTSVVVNGEEIAIDAQAVDNKNITAKHGDVSVELPGVSVRVNGDQDNRDVSVKLPGIAIDVDGSSL